MKEICAKGIDLEYREIQFLSKTFPRLGNGLDLETDTTDSDYFFYVVDIVSDFDVLEDWFSNPLLNIYIEVFYFMYWLQLPIFCMTLARSQSVIYCCFGSQIDSYFVNSEQNVFHKIAD